MLTRNILVLIAIFLFSRQLVAQSQWQWVKGTSCTSGGGAEGLAATTDEIGNAYAAGYFDGDSIVFDSIVLQNYSTTYDAFVAKYDGGGNLRWAKNTGGTGSDICYDIAADPNGNIFATGYSSSAILHCDSLSLPSQMQGGYFLVKYDSSGNALWGKFESQAVSEGNFVSADNSGNAIASGEFSGTLRFSSDSVTSIGGQDIFMTKYDAGGNVLWVRAINGDNQEYITGLSVDAAGRIFLSGCSASDTLHIGSFSIPDAGAIATGFVAAYDSSGNLLWVVSSPWSFIYSAVADANGDVYATLHCDTITVIGTDTIPLGRCILKFDAGGTLLWYRQVTDVPWLGLCTGNTGDVYAGGGFDPAHPNFSIGYDTVFPPPGSNDPLFIMKLDSAGTFLCGSAISSGADDQFGLAANTMGDLFIVADYAQNNFTVGTDTLYLTGFEDVYTAKWSCNNHTGIDEYPAFDQVVVYPNPSNGIITLKSNFTNGEISVCNVLGEIVFQSAINSSVTTIDLSDQSAGIYFVNLQTENGNFSQKIIIR